MGQDRYGNPTMNLAEADGVLGECEFLLSNPWTLFFSWTRAKELATRLRRARDTIARRVGADIEQTRIENLEVAKAWRSMRRT